MNLTAEKCQNFLSNLENRQIINELMQETGMSRINILKILLS